MPNVADLIEARIAHARNRDAHLKRTEEGIRDQRSALANEIEQLKIALNVLRDVLNEATPEPKKPMPPGTLDLDGVTIADGAAMIIEAKGGQAETGEILRQLREAGRISKTQGSYATLKKALERQPNRFTKVGRGLWALISEPADNQVQVAYVTDVTE